VTVLAQISRRKKEGDVSIGKGLLAGVLFASLVLAGCGGDSEEGAEVEFCRSLGAVGETLGELGTITPDTTTANLANQLGDLVTDVAAVVENGENVEDIEIDDFQQAAEDLEQAVEDIPDDQSTADTLAALQDPLAAVSTAAEDLRTRTDCLSILEDS
jgi:hypothetical protein